ncbi:MAG: hypothetical protein ACOZIN_02435 [Myxococcota bacterium]
MGRTVYDSLYLVLAIQNEGRFVTADRKFYDAMTGAFGEHLRWVGDLELGLA